MAYSNCLEYLLALIALNSMYFKGGYHLNHIIVSSLENPINRRNIYGVVNKRLMMRDLKMLFGLMSALL